MPSDRIIKSYVWRGDKCFFVSTITRDSSAMLGPGRYNETMVWEYDWEKAERGEILHMDSDMLGSIQTHQTVVKRLYLTGKAMTDE